MILTSLVAEGIIFKGMGKENFNLPSINCLSEQTSTGVWSGDIPVSSSLVGSDCLSADYIMQNTSWLRENIQVMLSGVA